MQRRVLVLYAGGTIGMEPSAQGYRPMADFAGVLRRQFAACAGLPACEIVEMAEPIDSANLQPAHWRAIAAELVARWDEWDGFVVLHGTDTMAWTASALSFMLLGADKPVILSGAQIPLGQPRSDAAANLQGALALAADPRIREVAIYFGGRLLRGNRSSKAHADRFAAFDSPNCLPLAEAGIGIVVHDDRLLRPGARDFALPAFDRAAVAVLTVHPGLSAPAVEALLGDPAVRGLVLCSYGVGNAPDADAHRRGGRRRPHAGSGLRQAARADRARARCGGYPRAIRPCPARRTGLSPPASFASVCSAGAGSGPGRLPRRACHGQITLLGKYVYTRLGELS